MAQQNTWTARHTRILESHTTPAGHSIALCCDPSSFYVTVDGSTVEHSGQRAPMESLYRAFCGDARPVR